MPPWQPGAKTQLTIKQLGFSTDQIQQALDQYRLEHDRYDDLAFMQYLGSSARVSARHYQQIATAAQLPIAWAPAQSTVRNLLKQGFSEEVITHYTALFVLQAREHRRLLTNGDAAFSRFCECRPRSLPEPLPGDWLPNVATVKSLRESLCADMDDITKQIGKFIHQHQFSVASDWNDRFRRWVETRYADTLSNQTAGSGNRESPIL